MRRSECLREEAFRGLGISYGTGLKLESISVRVHRPVKVHPDPFDLDILCLVDTPGTSGYIIEERKDWTVSIAQSLKWPLPPLSI